ncbi:hypothetical protein TIFTF001_018252 [Ficus carica]|uniref:Uncharacterized protein n=1 Tax=Ficus carica TaxID=3494 RepID=A0AA88D934_FICCA|nr:hypothetical protein TIFTF001_018252 [Ficus carica]
MATTMAILNAKCKATSNTPKNMINKPNNSKLPTSLLSLQNLPKGLSSSSLAGTAIAGAVFSTLSVCDPAMAVQQIAEIAESSGSSDSRGLALLLPIIPAIAWVLFNILQPALNQLNKMRETKGVIAGLGIGGGLAAMGLLSAPEAVAAEAAAGGDSRGQLLLIVITPAVLWVLYNILPPALNQLNRMRSE